MQKNQAQGGELALSHLDLWCEKINVFNYQIIIRKRIRRIKRFIDSQEKLCHRISKQTLL